MAANQVDFKILPSDQFSVYSPQTRSDKVITYFTLLSKLRGDILSVGQDDDPNDIVSAFYSSVGGTQTLHLVKADGSEVTASVPEPTVGTVTSVDLTASTGISVSGGPITTSGSITVTNTAPDQVVVLTGAGTTSISGTYPSFTITSNDQFVGTVTSVGLTMPAAFSVANSPVTASGTLAVTAAGLSSQYIRGDGQLANFPTPGGGGSSVNYYLNGSVSQGTFGGDTYYELSKTPIAGAGTNFTRTSASGDGYVASFITDANDPDQINIPGGNWNLEFYFNSSSSGGSPAFYGELYKVSVSNVFTLIASGSVNPESITGGTSVDQYYTSIAVPQTALLATDRLAIRVYVIVSGKNITLHTENSNFSEVITTFSTGLNSLNGLSDQVQYFAVGTSGTDFAISSSLDTHTFNLPTASATNRGALSSADWTTFNSKQGTITLTTTGSTGAATFISNTLNIPSYTDQFVGTVTSVNLTAGTGITVSGGPITTSGSITVTNNDRGSSQNIFKNIAVAGQSTIVADVNDDTLTVVAGSGVTITTNDTTDTLTISASGSGGTVTSVGTSAPLTGGPITATGTIGITQSGVSTDGYLSSTDWNTFNNKQSTLLFSGPLVNTSGTVSIPVATTSVSGYLNNTDWTTFNSKQNAITLTTTGTTGAATLIGATLNIPNYADQFVGTVTSVDLTAGTGITVSGGPITTSGSITVTNNDRGSSQNIFKNIAVAGQSTIVADVNDDTLTVVAGSGVTITTNDTTDTLTISATGSGGSVTSVGTSAPITGGTITTTGTIGITQSGAAADGYLSSTDWNTFNNKQNALTNPVTGTGTTNYVTKWTSGSAIGDSIIYDNGTNLGIGTTTPYGGTGVRSITVNAASYPTLALKVGDVFKGGIFGYSDHIDLYSEGYLNFETSGTEKMRIDTSGNLGIGTTSPTQKLEVNGVIESYYLEFKPVVFYDFNSDTTGDWGKNNSTLSVPNDSVTRYTSTGVDSNINKSFNFDGGQNQIIRIRYKVVTGPAGGGEIFYGNSQHGYDGSYFKGFTLVSDGGWHTLVLDMSNLTSGGTDWISYNVTSIRFDLTNVSGVAIDIDWISIGGNGYGTQYFENDVAFMNGNVGIGTTAPSQILHVTGNIRVTGAYYDSGNSAGTSGQILSSTATGTSWIAATGGSVTSVDLTAGTGISVSGGPITTSGSITVTNTAPDQTVVLTAGTGISTSGTYPSFTVTNSAPDQTVVLTASTGITTSGTYPNFTIANSAPDQTVVLTGGTGITTSGTYPSFTVTNSAPDQTVALTAGTGISISGTYPSFTITNTSAGGGTITGSGTTNYVPKWTSASAIGDSAIYDNAGNIGIGNTAPNQKLELSVGNAVTGGLRINYSAAATSEGMDITYLNSGNTTTSFDSRYNSDSAVMQFRMKTASTAVNAMTILGSGNVGISITAPASILHVTSSGANSYSNTITKGSNMKGIINTLSNNADDMIGIYFATGTAEGAHWSGITGSRSNSAVDWSTQLNFYTHDENLSNINNATQKMVIKGSGNVGIGTTTPLKKLVVTTGNNTNSSNNKSDALAYFGGGNDNADSQNISFPNPSITDGSIPGMAWWSPDVMFGRYKFEAFWSIKETHGGALGNSQKDIIRAYFYDSGGFSYIDKVIIPNGNVGIGTTAPNSKLSVNGGDFEFNRGTGALGNNYFVINKGTSNDGGFILRRDNTNDWQIVNVSTTGNLTFYAYGAASEVLTILRSNGNVGINNTNASYKLDISGDARILSGSLGVGVAPNATDGRIDASNDIVAFQTSDRRLKENITPITNALEKVKSLTGVMFDWKEETKSVHGYEGHDVGIIAQDVQAVLPEAVRTNETGYLSVRYEKMIALLIEGMKEQQLQIDELKSKLK